MRRILQLVFLFTLAIPAFGQLYINRDDVGLGTPGWQAACVGPLCAGGVGTPTSWNQTFLNISPSRDGNSMMMTETGTNYSNVMFHYSFGANSSMTYFTGTYSVNIPSTTPYQVFGMDMYQYLPGNVRLMFGSQCAIAGSTAGFWSFFDQGDNPPNGTWKVSTVPCPLTSGVWYTISLAVHRIPGDTSCAGGVPAEYYDSITQVAVPLSPTTYRLGFSYCSETASYSPDTGMQFDISSNATGGTLTAYVDEMSYYAFVPPSSTAPYNAITSPAIPDVVAAPSLGSITSNNALVTDTMVASNTEYRVTDSTTQTGANADFEYSVPCGGSADNNIISLSDNLFLVEDSGANFFLRHLNPSGNNSLPLYPNLDAAKGNLIVNCGEFSYTNDLLYYDHGAGSTAVITQYNLTGYNNPSIGAPSTLPTQTTIANYGNAGITGVQWRTLGGMNRSDNLNSVSFVMADGFSLTGGQGTGCIAAVAVANAVNPVATNNLYYVYNTCTGVVTEYSYSSGWSATVLGTISNADRFCVHNVKYHGGSWVTVSATFGSPCTGSVTGSGASYFFWNFTTATAIPCVACTGHETEYVNSFIGAESASSDGYNFQQIAYATAGAGLVNTSGTTMTFVSGIPPSSSMTGEIAIKGHAYGISSCNSSTCTLTTSAGTQTGVYYNWPVTAAQDSGTYGAPKLISYPSLWSQPDPCTGSFPFSNEPCYETPLDNHLSSNANPGNDAGMVFYSTTSYTNTSFPRAMGFVSVSGGVVTLTYGSPFAPSWTGHNIIINSTNCRISTYSSTTQVSVDTCSLGTLTTVPYYFTLYPGGSYDEINGIVGGGSSPPAGYNYRFGYTYNSTLSPYFSTQNGISACSQDGTVCLISTDWQCTLGTTLPSTTTTYCPPDWYASGTIPDGALIKPLLNNVGGYVYWNNGSACSLSGTEANPWNQTVGGTQTNGGCTNLTNVGAIRGDVIVMNTGASAPTTQTLTVTVSAGGTVTDNLSEVSCVGVATCFANYPTGTLVILTATPSTGYTLTSWAGACSGTGGCSITMSGAEAVTATFAPITAPSGLMIQSGVSGSQGVTFKP